ncbi:FadR/GntR family transcriptional regulator [Parageobacillus thermoglucosidasius]|jgi:GntR family transcriptional regulator, transcriptional repressor for pyruvate dehydrogenase complex|uniref:GntR family transcriptional regulator n=2 Tax=Parageobacillus thermoglucosidasius TaxID=1426 RepID=A0AAN1D8K8_PARTM|nr:FadR/GntR family transcriptional regulator [Parageobacillus thermoglucosidasius]ANZ32232.1 GntR family transcriptional regulator [Parageobacillus thermoglucosidasius]APM82967.1 GntR family transcriptional regulator [Parageobacillus thermoglucosidasius]KJX67361.1 GntR family transcriptional regulator [Parageobacillus thermoglucosidasius]OUM83871.1 MAG: GntR family transcriptional regulator [Parageobacillus thermoglucosidasius]RDE18651.1 FadR family transcriptional regulator [Parageobacillus 
MEIKPIKKKKVYHEIIEQIQTAIRSGQLKPGDRLPSERDLAKQFQVSRTTIKEAITVMEAIGVLEIRTGIGTFVRKTSENLDEDLNDILADNGAEIDELMEFRQAVEVEAAYYAAVRGSLEDKQKLRQQFEELEKAVRSKKLPAKSDFAFHMQISKMSGNVLFFKTMELISDKLLRSVTKNTVNTMAGAGNPKDVLEEHRAICEAILKGDGMEARRAMRHHLDSVIFRYRNAKLKSGV